MLKQIKKFIQEKWLRFSKRTYKCVFIVKIGFSVRFATIALATSRHLYVIPAGGAGLVSHQLDFRFAVKLVIRQQKIVQGINTECFHWSEWEVCRIYKSKLSRTLEQRDYIGASITNIRNIEVLQKELFWIYIYSIFINLQPAPCAFTILMMVN